MSSTGSKNLILEGTETYRNFIDSLSSHYTRDMYLHILKRYMSFCGTMNINDLFFKADVKYTQSRIIDFLKFLHEKNQLAPRSRGLFATAIKHFYDMNDVTSLNWKKINRFLGETYSVIADRPYSQEEISKLLEKATERQRVIVLLMCSAGLREGAIPNIKLSNIQKIARYNIYKITVYERAKEQYYTFCTPECASAIDNYLEYRKRYGETLKPTSPLIREEFNKLDPFHIAKPRFLTKSSIHFTMYMLIKDSGLRESEQQKEELVEDTKKKYKRYQVMQSHGLRKFFETESVKAGMSPLYASILMGHDNGLETKYFKPTESDLLEGSDKMAGYVDVMDYLTINEENKLRREVEQLRVERSAIDSLRYELDELKSSLSQRKRKIEK
jgi:integrase